MRSEAVPSVSTYRRSPGAWSVRYRWQGKQYEERGYSTLRAAQERVDELRADLRQRVQRLHSPATVADLAARWWDEYALSDKIAVATRTSYQTAVRRILATIGHIPAVDVTTAMLVQWHAALPAQLGVSPRAANIALTALSSIYQRNVEWGVVERNPARGVRRHREPKRTVVLPTPDDVARLGMVAPSDRDQAMLLVATCAGLRMGELFGLNCGDLVDGRLSVRRAVDQRGDLKPPKTHEQRVVPLPPIVADWLAGYIGAMPPDQPMFMAHGKRALVPVWRRDVWNPWRAAAGTEVMWRHLRHYYAARIASVGAGILQCCRWMGHASITTTMDRYGFLFDHDESRVMAALERQ